MRFAHSLLAPAALAIAALGLAAPQLANAHTALVSSSPAANATVAAPTKIELRFNEAIIGATARTEIAMTGMPGMGSHAPMPITGFTAQLGKDRKSMTLLLRRPLSAHVRRREMKATRSVTTDMNSNYRRQHCVGSNFIRSARAVLASLAGYTVSSSEAIPAFCLRRRKLCHAFHHSGNEQPALAFSRPAWLHHSSSLSVCSLLLRSCCSRLCLISRHSLEARAFHGPATASKNASQGGALCAA